MKIEKEAGRPLVAVAAFGALSIAMHRYVPGHVPVVSDASVSDIIAFAAASGISLAAFRSPNALQQVDLLQAGLQAAGIDDPAPNIAPAALNPDAACLAKAADVTRVPAEVVAKHWFLFATLPDDGVSVDGVRRRIQEWEKKAWGELPRLSEDIALRLASGLAVVSDGDAKKLQTRVAQNSWNRRREALVQALTDARFHRVLLLEERAGMAPPGPARASTADVPSQEDIAGYFLLTSSVPAPHMPGHHVRAHVKRLQKHRAAPLDGLLALRAVLSALQLPPTHPALLPVHRKALPDEAAFPVAYSSEPQQVATSRYRNAIDSPSVVGDAFVGNDGYHYLRLISGKRGDHLIVAASGDQCASLRVPQRKADGVWDELKIERSREALPKLGDAANWESVMYVHLRRQQRRVRYMRDKVPRVWPPHGPDTVSSVSAAVPVSPAASAPAADPWAAARAQLAEYAKVRLPEAPTRTAPARVAIQIRPSRSAGGLV